MEDELACYAFLNASFQSVRSENNKKTKSPMFQVCKASLTPLPKTPMDPGVGRTPLISRWILGRLWDVAP